MDPLPSPCISRLPLPPLLFLRPRLRPHRRRALRLHGQRTRLGAKRRDGLLRRRFLIGIHLLRAQLWRRRRRADQSVGLPCVHHPRRAADLHRRAVVLGRVSEQADRRRRHPERPHHQQLEDHRHHAAHRGLAVGHWTVDVVRPAEILPPGAGDNAEFLSLPPPQEGGDVVLRHCDNPESHALDAVRSELVVPVEQRARADMAGPAPGDILLHRRVGRSIMAIRLPLQIALLDPTSLRHRPRRSALGTDLVGHLEHRPVPPVGWGIHGWCTGVTVTMAVARRAGLDPGRWAGHDTAQYADESTRRIYAHLSASTRFDRDGGSEGGHAE